MPKTGLAISRLHALMIGTNEYESPERENLRGYPFKLSVPPLGMLFEFKYFVEYVPQFQCEKIDETW